MSVAFADFAAVWGFFFLNIMSPGPNVLNTIGTAMGSGRRAGIAAALAVGPGVLLWAVAAVLGIATLLRAGPWAEIAITALAVCLLVWFATRYLRRAFARTETEAKRGLSVRAAALASLGILATNPKAMTSWIIILSLFPAAEAGLADYLVLVAGAALLAMGGHVFYAVVFSTRPAAALYARAAPAINGGVGVFFLIVAAGLVRDLLA
ncbi:MAG: LysE family translocator [Rubricella sp.]